MLDRIMSNMSKEFSYQGKTLTYLKMKAFEVVKVYTNTDRFERKLVKDEWGRLYLYEYREEMGFPDDRIDEFYATVQNEKDADLFNQEQEIYSRPHIYIGPGINIIVRGG